MYKIFISYSHKDEAWKDPLVTQLGVLQNQITLEIWDDRRIQGGDEWLSEIENAQQSANIAILLISSTFLTSNLIMEKEVPLLLERRQKQGIRIFPVIVKPCAWQKIDPEYPYLYSLPGFRFCDLLLSQGQYREVQKRASQTLKYEKESWYSLLSIALDKLPLGRAFLLEATARALRAPGQSLLNQARDYLQQAVAGLREAGTSHHLPRGLFARVAFYRAQNEFALAWADLEEAREIAERGEMKLHLADYHLEACRLEIKEQKANSKKQAEEHFNIAAEMIEKMGYGRRRPEVEELRRELEAL